LTTAPLPRQTIEVLTTDGWRLALEHGPPSGRARATLLCGPAMMADRRSLDRPSGAGMGAFFQRRGYNVYLLDPRGHGESGPRASRSVNWSYDDIVQRDLPATIRAVAARHPEQPLVLLGHSLCGHGGAATLGLDQRLPVDALVMLTSNIWLPQLEPSRAHWWSKRALLASWSRVTRLRGFFPAKMLRLGSNDEPRSYVAQFNAWAQTGRWCDETGQIDYLAAMEQVRQPVLSVSARGDRLLCRTICARRFAWHLRRAALTFLEVGAKELMRRGEPGHMDVVIDPKSVALWRRIDGWLGEQLGI
jgi:predicted alpha/beta hydrolase